MALLKFYDTGKRWETLFYGAMQRLCKLIQNCTKSINNMANAVRERCRIDKNLSDLYSDHEARINIGLTGDFTPSRTVTHHHDSVYVPLINKLKSDIRNLEADVENSLASFTPCSCVMPQKPPDPCDCTGADANRDNCPCGKEKCTCHESSTPQCDCEPPASETDGCTCGKNNCQCHAVAGPLQSKTIRIPEVSIGMGPLCYILQARGGFKGPGPAESSISIPDEPDGGKVTINATACGAGAGPELIGTPILFIFSVLVNGSSIYSIQRTFVGVYGNNASSSLSFSKEVTGRKKGDTVAVKIQALHCPEDWCLSTSGSVSYSYQ